MKLKQLFSNVKIDSGCWPIALTVAAAVWLVGFQLPDLHAEESVFKTPVSARVKTLAPRSNSGRSDQMDQRSRPAVPATATVRRPTLPDAKLPQYQLRGQPVPTDENIRDARLRFDLSLSDRTLLVETVIKIDDKPFRMVRQQRVEQILEALHFEESQADTVAPSSTGAYSVATTAAEFVRRYLTAADRTGVVEEVRWLLATRVDGPVLLVLNDNFQRFRRDQRPAYRILDRNRDGSITADERKLAVRSLNECDLNRDQIVDFLEIARVADDPRVSHVSRTPAGSKKLLIMLFDDSESRDPDIVLSVSFHSSDPEKSTFVVERVNEELRSERMATPDDSTIAIRIEGTPVWFSAIQGGESDQVSIGAVSDGYPILPVIDSNDDGRLTIRELRDVEKRLELFDRDQDGTITIDETRSTVRVCFGLGPVVHNELAGLRSVNPKPVGSGAVAPQWFLRMDRNKDNDLTRDEFPGTSAQFDGLDKNQDELISADEAAASERKSAEAPDK